MVADAAAAKDTYALNAADDERIRSEDSGDAESGDVHSCEEVLTPTFSTPA